MGEGTAHLAWKRPGLPTTWVRVLKNHPESYEALPGYVWLDMPGKVRHVEERELEFSVEQDIGEGEY